jgi:hypothetical protein
MADFDASGALLEQVNQALANATPLRIQGGNSKAFLGREVAGEVLDTRAHRGIVATTRPSWWSPRAGTPLRVARGARRGRADAAVRTAGLRRRHRRRHDRQRTVRATAAMVRLGARLRARHPGDHRPRQAACASVAR